MVFSFTRAGAYSAKGATAHPLESRSKSGYRPF